MEIPDITSKRVAILGFGEKEGMATAEFLLRHGITPVLFDRKDVSLWTDEQKAFIQSKSIPCVTGEDYLRRLDDFEVIFRNPAVPRLTPQLTRLEKRGVIITSQTKWFFDHCPARIIGVTGTKGKGTTSSLIYEILKKNFEFPLLHHPLRQDRIGQEGLGEQAVSNSQKRPNIYLTGNIGKTQPFEFLDKLKPTDWVVCELSSFQLQDLDKSPHIGVVLMVTSEHLDHHASQEEYVAAKEAVVKFQAADDVAVINADFENSVKIGALGQGKKMYFSRQQSVSRGSYAKDGAVYVSMDGLFAEILKQGDLRLKGEHNLENVCAAVCAAIAADCGIQAIQEAVKDFKGLEHRLELVAEKDGIAFYNDSFSTTPETAIAAVKSFTEPEIVILGGSSKNSDFRGLADVICKTPNIKAIIFIGEEGKKIRSLLAERGGLPAYFEGAESMDGIFAQIRQVATAGDVVLLSPACASFGMFKNYKDRGEQFKRAVEAWS